MTGILIATIVALQVPDTVVPLRSASRIVLEQDRGAITVSGWDGAGLGVGVSGGAGPTFSYEGEILRVVADPSGELRVRIPRSVPVAVRGRQVAITVFSASRIWRS